MSYKLILLLILTIECFVGAYYIYFKKGNSAQSVKILSTILTVLGFVFLQAFVSNYFGRSNSHPLLVLYSYLFFVFCVFLPPTYYLYVISLVKKQDEVLSLKKIQVHYWPALFVFTINMFSFIALYILEPGSRNYLMLEQIVTYINFVSLFLIFLLQNVFYIYLSWIFYYEQKAISDEAKAQSTSLTIKWIFTFIMLYTIFIVSLYVFLTPLPGKLLFRIFTVIYIGLLIYYGSNNYQFIVENTLVRNLDNEKLSKLKIELINVMERNKIYLEDDLTVTKLAHSIDTNSKYLSYLINKEFNTNFSSFVNGYRVDNAKLLLNDPSNNIYTIKTIAEMTGFKSKSAFNAAFKKNTNQTPSQFKNRP